MCIKLENARCAQVLHFAETPSLFERIFDQGHDLDRLIAALLLVVKGLYALRTNGKGNPSRNRGERESHHAVGFTRRDA
jgi:hypothetical protein